MKPLDALVELRTEKVEGAKDPALPYVGLEQIDQGAPRLLGWLPSSASVSTNAKFEKDDILFGKLRPNLKKSLRAPFDGYCSTDILVLRARDGIDTRFAGHIFQWERVFNAAAITAAGTKMPRTSWNELRRFRVFLPPTSDEQRRVAAVLDALDAAIDKTSAVIAKLKQVRSGPNSRAFDAVFLAAVLASPIGQRQLDALNTCGNRQGINYQQLGAFMVPWPKRDERESISEQLEALKARIDSESVEQQKLAELKTGLMSDLLTGRVRVPEAIHSGVVA